MDGSTSACGSTSRSSYLPEETAPQSRFFPDPIKQAATDDLISWNNLSPRLGVIYDLTGSAKTLVKAYYSRYYWQIFTTKTGQASLAGTRTFRYTWIDLNGDRRFTTNELGALRSVDDPATRPDRDRSRISSRRSPTSSRRVSCTS